MAQQQREQQQQQQEEAQSEFAAASGAAQLVCVLEVCKLMCFVDLSVREN